MTPAPHPKPLPCPNRECLRSKPPRAEKTPTLVQNMWWRVRCSSCDYRGPCAATEAEAIRLHNALCAASGIPTEELEKLEAEWREAAAYIYDAAEAEDSFEIAESGRLNQCAKELRSLISRVTEGKKHE